MIKIEFKSIQSIIGFAIDLHITQIIVKISINMNASKSTLIPNQLNTAIII